MSSKSNFNPWTDITKMHDKFGVGGVVDAMNTPDLMAFVNFRMSLLAEEYEETREAVEAQDAEEFVDGLIDLIVIAIGTLDLLGINVEEAWNRVMDANMSKEAGVKPGRPNPLKLPDLMKPAGWESPSHLNNYGYLPEIWPNPWYTSTEKEGS